MKTLPKLVLVKKDNSPWYQLYVDGKFGVEAKEGDLSQFCKVLQAFEIIESVTLFETNEDQLKEFDKENPEFLEFM